MERLMRVFNLNGEKRYVSLPFKTFYRDNYEEHFNVDSRLSCSIVAEKLENNIVRSRSTIRDYVLCNDFKYFVTITCNGNKCSRYDFDEFYKFIRNHIKYYVTKYRDLDLSYIFVPEKHKDGAWHLHGVLGKDWKDFIYKNSFGYLSFCIFDNFGFSNVSLIRSKYRCSSYITKYITKDLYDRGKAKHLYFCSKGLNKPVLVDEFLYDSRLFKSKYFDYSNDFVSIIYKPSKTIENVIRLLRYVST